MQFRIQKLLTLVFIIRLLTLVLPWLTVTLLFPEKSALNFLQFTASSWNRWDATHYLFLAQNWYTNVGDAANFIVFFPLYPAILGFFTMILKNPEITGIFLSIVLSLLGSYYFYKLVAIDYSEKVAWLSTIALTIFPTSYFFNAPYTESLFLLTFSLSMYLARKREWILSGAVAGLGALTRPFGFLILPAIFTEWFFEKDRKWKQLFSIVIPTIIAGGLYLYLNKVIYDNFFEFQKILANHWQKHLMSPIIGIQDSWRVAFSGGLTNYVIMVGWAESLSITTAWILIPFVFKYLRRSWAVFYILSIVLFSSTSFILSTPRYLLSIPPLFVLLALAEKNSFFKVIWQVTSVALLFCLSILFVRGQWAF